MQSSTQQNCVQRCKAEHAAEHGRCRVGVSQHGRVEGSASALEETVRARTSQDGTRQMTSTYCTTPHHAPTPTHGSHVHTPTPTPTHALSLSLSHTHTHTHTHALTRTPTHTHSLTNSLTHSLTRAHWTAPCQRTVRSPTYCILSSCVLQRTAETRIMQVPLTQPTSPARLLHGRHPRDLHLYLHTGRRATDLRAAASYWRYSLLAVHLQPFYAVNTPNCPFTTSA